MKLSEKLLNELNKQVTLELESSYIYYGMKTYFSNLGIPGATHWFDLQYKEEIRHAEDFIAFIEEMDGKVVLGELKKPSTEYKSILDVFETGLEHEKLISKSISDILEIAIEEKNYAAENFLRTYIDEQLEEEDNFRSQIDLIKLAGDDKAAFFKVDSILGGR